MHEKRGVIEPGRTPPEDDSQKQATVEELEQHPTKRTSDSVSDKLKEDNFVSGNENSEQ